MKNCPWIIISPKSFHGAIDRSGMRVTFKENLGFGSHNGNILHVNGSSEKDSNHRPIYGEGRNIPN